MYSKTTLLVVQKLLTLYALISRHSTLDLICQILFLSEGRWSVASYEILCVDNVSDIMSIEKVSGKEKELNLVYDKINSKETTLRIILGTYWDCLIILSNLEGHNIIYVRQTCKRSKVTMALQLEVNEKIFCIGQSRVDKQGCRI